MIRAVVRNGGILPLQPLPAEWREGREVVVSDSDETALNGSEDYEQWVSAMNELTAPLNDANEWREIDAALSEADGDFAALPTLRTENWLLP